MRAKRFVIICTSVVSLLLLSACLKATSLTNIPIEVEPSTQLVSSTSTVKPEFISYVRPTPDATVALDEYEESLDAISPHVRGVEVVIWPFEIDNPNTRSSKTIFERSRLFVDGQEANRDGLVVASGGNPYDVYDKDGKLLRTLDAGPYYLSWAPKLNIGPHVLTLQIESASGVKLEYTWSITIEK
jgi:hypothetical protein